MLIEFSVANFRSIRERQTLSLVASQGGELQERNVAEQQDDIDRVLRSAAVYGPNAAGKSNLLRAALTLQQLVVGSASSQEGQPLGVQPFLLQAQSAREPTEFDIVYVATDGTRYEYFCAVSAERVHVEWMVAYPHGRPQRWFERKFNSNDQKYEWWFGPNFKGEKAERKVWQDFTRSNALFFSTAVQLNNEQLRPAFRWMAEGLIVKTAESNLNPFLSLELLKQETGRTRIMEYMRAADIGIDRMEVLEEDATFPTAFIPGQAFLFAPAPTSGPAEGSPKQPIGAPVFNPAGFPLPSNFSLGTPKRLRVLTWHKRVDTNEDISFELGDESEGTRTLFEFTGAWVRALETGATLFIDEIDRSLHPYITRFLLGLFHGKSNPKNAQLIFTTHDTTLLDTELLRRDQVWFIEKDSNQATHLYPLLEYKPRKDEALERGYLRGRYGAVPIVGEVGG